MFTLIQHQLWQMRWRLLGCGLLYLIAIPMSYLNLAPKFTPMVSLVCLIPICISGFTSGSILNDPLIELSILSGQASARSLWLVRLGIIAVPSLLLQAGLWTTALPFARNWQSYSFTLIMTLFMIGMCHWLARALKHSLTAIIIMSMLLLVQQSSVSEWLGLMDNRYPTFNHWKRAFFMPFDLFILPPEIEAYRWGNALRFGVIGGLAWFMAWWLYGFEEPLIRKQRAD